MHASDNKPLRGFVVYPTYRILDEEIDGKKTKKSVVYLFGRLENGESFLAIKEYKPYFYILKHEYKKNKDKLDKTLKSFNATIEDTEYKDFSDEEVLKIILEIPPDVINLRKTLEDGGGTATPTVNAAGTYTLTVTDPSNGCTNTDQAVVTSSGALPNTAAGTDKVLTCAVTSVVLNGSSSTPGVTYSWAGPGIVSGGGTATPTVNAAGTYTLTVTDPSNGCSNTDQALVTSSAALPNAAAGSDKVLNCAITSVVLNGSSSTPGVTFSWAGPGIVSGGGTATPTVNATGTYTLTVTDPSNGCSNTDQAVVTSSGALPNAAAGTDKVLTCAITSVVLNGSSSTPGVTYSWAGPGIVSGGGTATPTVNATGTYTLTVTDPSNGCSNTDQAVVTSSGALPNAAAGTDRVLTCAITSVVLNGSSSTPGVTFSWAGPGIVSGGGTATPTVNATGTYTLTVTDPSNGCSASDQAIVTQSSPFTISANISDNPCPQLVIGSIDISVNGGTPPFQYAWSSGDTTQDLTGLFGGQYDLQVTDAAGCSVDTSFIIKQGIFEVEAYNDTTINLGESIQLLGTVNGGSGLESFAWTQGTTLSCDDCPEPLATPPSDIVYVLTVTDTNGCTGIDSVKIMVNEFFELYISNVFTPNEDGVNDRFEVMGNTDAVTSFELWVFNRWNETVFTSNDIYRGWDGVYEGILQDPDVFIYAMKATFLNGKAKTYKGILVLLR